MPVLMITLPSGATASTQPSSVFTWSPGAVERGQRGDEVDVGVLAGPHVLLARRGVWHRWVADGASERGAVGQHRLEEVLVGAEAHRDDAQEATLEVVDALVEQHRARR